MKQKLPEKKSSSQNLYLGEIRKTTILSDSWVKCSLIGLLIAKFFNKRNLVNLFDFRIIDLSIDLRNLKKNENFILNCVMLFALSVFLLTYRSKTTNIVEKNNFNLTKVQGQNYYRKDYMGIYKKSFKNLNKNFDIFLPNIFDKKKLYKHESNLNIITHIKEKKELTYNLDFSENFYFFAREMENEDYFWIRKEILQNLQSWGESNEILVKSSFFLKEKGNLYLSNYMKANLWQFFARNYRHWEKVEREVFKENIIEYFSNELNNPKLCITLENILSNAVYKFSKYLIYKLKKSDIKIRNTNSLSGQINKSINLLDSSPTCKKNVERNLQFLLLANLNEFHNLHTESYFFEGITKILYLKDKSVSKHVFGKRTFLNKSLSSLEKKPDLYFGSLKKPLISQYIININNLFSQQKRKKMSCKFFSFFKPLLMDEFIQKTISEEKVNKISKNIRRIYQLKNNMESDDIEIISWTIRRYHSNFLLNCSLPFNFAYDIVCQNYFFNEKVVKNKSKKFLLEIFNLLPLLSKLKKSFSMKLIKSIELKEQLTKKTNELNVLMDQSNKIKDQNFTKKIFLMFEENNDKNELIKNSIQNNSYRYCSKFFTNSSFKFLYSKGNYQNYIFHKDSILWKGSVKKSFIYNFENLKYEKLAFEVDLRLYEIKKSLKKMVPYQFLIKQKLTKILKNINKIINKLEISTNITNVYIKQNDILNKTLVKNYNFIERDINKLITYLFINEKNNKIIIHYLLTTFSTKNNILLDRIKNEKLFFNLNNYLINFQSNYKRNFLFYWKINDLENTSIIYSQFLKIFFKYHQFNQNLKKNTFFFFEKEISQQIQLKLNNFSLFEKTKFVSIFDSYEKMLRQINLYFSTNSKIYFLKQEKNTFSIIFTEKEVETNRTSKEMLLDIDNTKIKNYYNILRYKALTRNRNRNSLIFQSTSKIFLSPIFKYSKFKNLKNQVENKKLIYIDKIFNKSNKFEILNFFEKYILVKDSNYTSWFFTSEWWEYNIHIFMETLQKRVVIIDYYLQYFLDKNIQFIRKNLVTLFENQKKLYTLDSKWNSRLFFYYREKMTLNFLWSDLQFINNFNNLHWAIFSLLAFVLPFYQNYLSIFIGSDSIDLWTYFENIKYLTDASRASYFTELSHHNKTQLNKTENLLIYFFSNLKHYARNIRFYLVTKKKLNKWLLSNKCLDLSRRKRNLLVQSLIIPTRIKEYGFQSHSPSKILNNKLFGYNRNPQQGLSYLRYLSRMLKKNLINYSLHLADKWVCFASLQKMISSQTLQQTQKFNPRFQKIPIPLQLGLSCSKGILLIGPVETGRSYLIKNLAADSSVPLLGISINKLMYNKPDVITESWMNILIESLRRLNLILDLAKGMSPCIIWIRNIHQLDVNRSTQNIESDPTFLLGILLKHFQTDSLETRTKNNIIMIGSTHVPTKVDPSLISPDRLDRILNIRLLNAYQRKNQFTILLNRKNLQLNKNLSYFNEFGSRTMGYNIRDLVALTNEISLISLTKNKSFVYNNIIKLAFHRQVLGFSHTNNKPNYQQNFKILLYKIGRAIIQNILIEDFATNPLNISNYLWKRKFYYLSKWYSEPSMDDSIIKESTILVNVLGCLAGIAARDSWFLLEKDSNESISLDKSIENDLGLAFSILEAFSSDFPWLETCETQLHNYKRKKQNIFLTKNFLNVMHDGTFIIANKNITTTQNNLQDGSLLSRKKILNRKISEFNNIVWSPRFWRLSFSRSHLFNWIKRPNDFEFFHTFGFSKKMNLERKNHYDQFIGKKKEQLFYERILPRVRKRNVEELESQFENILLEEQFEILGFFGSSTQYQMESQLENKPRLFLGKRILWNPIGSFSQLRHFVFSRQEFFVDEEMLRRLYITYGVRRERERSLSSHRIKRFFISRGYNKDLINKLSVRWWNQLPINQKQDIYTLKRIEKIGIRLKRPQVFTPVYLYQRWLIENIPGKFSRLDLLTHRNRWIKFNTPLLNDSFTYNILLESYQYLFEFFLSNKVLLNRMSRILLKKKWIFQNEIVDIIHNIKDIEFSE